MSKLRDPRAVARATGCKEQDVALVLPHLLACLETEGMLKPEIVVGILATAAVESSFRVVEEAWWLSKKARADWFDSKKYSRIDRVTHERYFGRGIIQLTWDYNYQKFGNLIGVDLYHHPDLALQPDIAAKVLVSFFKVNGVVSLCLAKKWTAVRRKVNGGDNGLPRFLECVKALQQLAEQSK